MKKKKDVKKIKFATSPSEFGTWKSVEIDPKPSEDENTKKDYPTDEDWLSRNRRGSLDWRKWQDCKN